MPVCLCYVTALPSGYTHSVHWTVHLESWPKLILCHPLIYRWIDWAWEWKASRHTHTVWACWTSRRWLGAGGVQLLFQYPFRGQRARNPFNYCLVFCISPPSPANPHSLVTSVSLPRLPLGTKTSFLVFPPKPVLAKWKPSAQTGVWAVTSCRTTALLRSQCWAARSDSDGLGWDRNSAFLTAPAGVLRILVFGPPNGQQGTAERPVTSAWIRCFCLYSSTFSLVDLLPCTLWEGTTEHFGNCHCRSLFLFRLWVPIKLP